MFDAAAPATGADRTTRALDAALTRPRPDAAVLTVAGEVDTLTAQRLEAGLARLLAQPGGVLGVDLTDVTFLASCGLALLVKAAVMASGSGRRLRLVVHGRPVLRPLQITGTDQLFDLHSTLELALAPAP